MGYCPWKDRKKYVANIGVVFGQKSQLWFDLPAIDTFEMLRTVYSVPKVAFQRRLNYMTKLLDVEEVIKSPVRKLSLGERMKCEVIASFLHNPKILFLDEPTIGMDVISKNKLRVFVKKINKQYGTTVILTTHNMEDVEKLCKRIILINHGKIVYDGLLKDIVEKYIHSKTLRIKFGSTTGALRLPKGTKIIKKTTYSAEIEVYIKKQKVQKVIAHLLKHFDVEDIAIDEPPIDEVIEDIYRHEGAEQ